MSKVAVVTGGSRGIGKEICKVLAEAGYSVVINYNNSKDEAIGLMYDIREMGRTAIALKADVSIRDEAEYLINHSIEQLGHVDLLVNNAGIAQKSMFTDISAESWRKVFAVNVDGTFNCSQLAVRDMIKRHKGKIINISSIWGITGASCEVHYSSSKAAVIGMTKALAKELGPSGIQVNCIAPGVIDTDMNCELNEKDIDNIKVETPLGRIGLAKEIASLALFLSSEKSDFITGQVISPNGGILI